MTGVKINYAVYRVCKKSRVDCKHYRTNRNGPSLGDIAKARGMTKLARDTGLSRESLYKSLSGKQAPRSDTLFKVIYAMGFKVTVKPLATHD